MLVTVAAFQSPAEAHLLRQLLEDEGIVAFVADEYTASLLPDFALAFGGAKVQVLAIQAEEAKAILEKLAATDG